MNTSPANLRVLLVDDEATIRTVFGKELARIGFEVTTAENAEAARRLLDGGDFDAVVLDIRMPGMSGEEFLPEVRRKHPTMPVIILTGHANVELAAGLMRDGACDLLTKPCTVRQLAAALERAAEREHLRAATRTLTNFVRAAEEPERPVYESESMRRALAMVAKVAGTDEPVLIAGESGVGKELFAHEIRRLGSRASGPFIAVNCAAISATLLESELFGHEKGSFSGATERRIGFFEMADKGTIFLDEIGDMALDMQAKLLRVLQSGEYWRVGGARALRADVRLVAATNRDLHAACAAGRFREDLLYRINTIVIEVPPLRDRPEDVALLARHFAAQARRTGGPAGITPAALDALRGHLWPGNVRELRNAIRRAAILCEGANIDLADLPPAIFRDAPSDARQEAPVDASLTLEEVEKRHILGVLKANGGNKAKAARSLGVAVKTIYNKLESWGIESAD